MTNAFVVTGTLTSATTVELDEPLPLSAGKVRVVVETEATAAWVERPDFRQVLHRIWAEQNARGFVPPTAEEVENRIREVREGWDD